MRIFFLLGAFLSAHGVIGQPGFRPGYILTSPKDTIHGYILEKRNSFMNEHCVFKKNPDSGQRDYGPAELFGYGFTRDKFFSSQEIIVKEIPTRYFVEELVHGRLILFRLNTDFFLLDSDKKIERLFITRTTIHANDRDYVKTRDNYIELLSQKMNDCPDIKSRIANTTLTERSLTLLIEKYNDCGGSVKSLSFKRTGPG